MPYKKNYRKRKPRRYRKVWKRKAPAPSSGITRPRVIKFKRSLAETIILNSAIPPNGWTPEAVTGALFRQFQTGLIDVPDRTDFQNLFTAYRIKGVRIQGYVSNTSSDSNNQQLMLYWNQNWQGTNTTTLSEQFFLDRPRTKRKLLLHISGAPASDIYQPMRHLSLTYATSINAVYGTIKPS